MKEEEKEDLLWSIFTVLYICTFKSDKNKIEQCMLGMTKHIYLSSTIKPNLLSLKIVFNKSKFIQPTPK